MADAVVKRDSSDDGLRPRLNPDIYRHLLSILHTTEVLTCACVCTALRQLCESALRVSPLCCVRGSPISGAKLLWLLKERLRGECVRLDVSGCANLTKVQVCAAVAASPKLSTLSCLQVGPGSWSSKQLAKLVESLGRADGASVCIDVRAEMKNDLHEGSPFLGCLSSAALHVERLTLIADCVSSVAAEAGAAGDGPAAIAAAAAIAAIDLSDDPQAADGDEPPDNEQAAAIGRLCRALLPPSESAGAREAENLRGLRALDASSGALSMRGAATLLLAPLLSASRCAMHTLSATGLSQGMMTALAPALAANHSLTTLRLDSNMIFGAATAALAAALAHHPSLSHLSLDSNPLLDAVCLRASSLSLLPPPLLFCSSSTDGGAPRYARRSQGGEAIAALLLTTRLKCLSMRFTGVGDATCAALATGLGDATCRLGDATGDARGRGGCALRSLHLAGNRISSAGATRLAGSLGRLTLLDMTANLELTPEAAVAIASALPSSRLQCLRLAGCKVDKRGCSRLAATLMLSPLASLDLSANHFGSEGSDELAWVLADCTALTALNLADCDLDDDAADELLEALGGGDDADAQPPPLRALDLRWNKLSAPRHQGGRGISADARVDSSSQKEMSAADRQTAHLEQTWQQAKASGKKIYVPKWQREQKEREVGKRSGSTGSAIA